MRRDKELLTKILLALEADEPLGSANDLAFLGDDVMTINRHIGLLAEKGLVDGYHIGGASTHKNDWLWQEVSLTSAGHDALEETRTNKAGKWFLDQLKGAGRMAAPEVVKLAVAHPEYLQHATEQVGKLFTV